MVIRDDSGPVGDALSRLIHDKTWNGEFWGRDGAIQLALKQFNQLVNWRTDSQARAAAHSSLSSTYYSATGNAASRFKTAPWHSKPLWAVRAVKCRSQAVRCSDEVERTVGLKSMTPDQLDVRSKILQRLRRDYDYASRCIEEALSRPNLRDESRALLLAGKSEILDHQRKLSEASVVILDVMELEPKVRIQTRVRLRKTFGDHYARYESYDMARKEYWRALDLVREAGGMADQEAKIQALLAQLPK